MMHCVICSAARKSSARRLTGWVALNFGAGNVYYCPSCWEKVAPAIVPNNASINVKADLSGLQDAN
jgi:hypothetical protein